jgi:hypothetical protein
MVFPGVIGCVSSSHRDVIRARGGIDVSYAGAHRDDPRVRQLFESFPTTRRNAYEKIRRRTGLEPKDPGAIVLRLTDRRWRDGTYAAWASPRTFGRRAGVLVNYYTDAILANPSGFPYLLSHEYIHAIMIQLMGPRRFSSLPTWVKEGVATWGADQLAAKLRYYVCVKKRGPDDLIDGLERRAHERSFHHYEDYLEDALVFEYVAVRRGAATVRRLIGKIVDSANPELAFEETLAVRWGEFKEDAERFARQRITGLDCSRRSRRVVHVTEFIQSGRVAEAKAVLVRHLEENPDAVDALMLLGRCHLELGEWWDAVEVFRRVAAHAAATGEQRGQARALADRLQRCLDDPSCEPSAPAPAPVPPPEPPRVEINLIPPQAVEPPGS